MKKGFTLIELLAVIVVLGLIAVIVVPKILDLVDDSKLGVVKENALQYIKAIESHNQEAALDNKPEDRIVGNSIDIADINIKVKGKKPDSGYLTIDEDNRVDSGELCFGNFKATYENSEVTVEKVKSCVALVPGIYDYETGTRLANWDELVENYNLNIERNYNNNTLSIDNGTDGNSLHYVIKTYFPEYYSNFINTSSGHKKIKLVVPSNVTKIGESTAKYLDSLYEVYLPDSVVSLGEEAFWGCYIIKIRLSKNLKVLSAHSLAQNFHLSKIELPDGLETIGNYALYDNQLSKITIPNTVTYIGERAFSSNQLQELYIPSSVVEIDGPISDFNHNLKKIIVDKNNKNYVSENDVVLYDKNKTKLIDYARGSSNTTLTIPSSVTYIENSILFYHHKLTSIVFEDTNNWIFDAPFASENITFDATDPAENASKFYEAIQFENHGSASFYFKLKKVQSN